MLGDWFGNFSIRTGNDEEQKICWEIYKKLVCRRRTSCSCNSISAVSFSQDSASTLLRLDEHVFHVYVKCSSCLQQCEDYKNQTSFSRVMITNVLPHVLWITVYIHFWGLLPSNIILPGAKFTLHPSLALSYIGSVTAWHSSSGHQPNFAAWYLHATRWPSRLPLGGQTVYCDLIYSKTDSWSTSIMKWMKDAGWLNHPRCCKPHEAIWFKFRF